MQSLFWKISPTKKRARNRKFILMAWLPLIITISLFSGKYMNFKELILSGIIVTFIMGLFLVFNQIAPYRLRKYYMDNKGITIAKGRNRKYFLWNQFECFYVYNEFNSNFKGGEKSKERLWELEQLLELNKF